MIHRSEPVAVKGPAATAQEWHTISGGATHAGDPGPTEQQRSAIVASGDLSQLQLFSKPDWGNKTPVRYYFGYSGQLVTPKSARVGGWSSSGTPALGDYAPLRA